MAAGPAIIPGRNVDPPQKATEETLSKIHDKSHAAGLGYRAFLRFSNARSTLLAAGTAYFAFLAIFALATFAYGVTAILGAGGLEDVLTETLQSAFPGLIGENGLDPATLRQVGQTTSVIGLIVLLYSGSASMVALSRSLHLIYGAPKDPRNIVWFRIRLLLWLFALAPLMALSFIPATALSTFSEPVRDWIGEGSFWVSDLITVGAVLLSGGLAFLTIYLMLGHLGGVMPYRTPRLVGTLVGTIGIETLKYVMTLVITWSLDKPQYGAATVPITVMFVLYLQTIVLYFSAAITAGIAEGVPHIEESTGRSIPGTTSSGNDSNDDAADGRSDTPQPDDQAAGRTKRDQDGGTPGEAVDDIAAAGGAAAGGSVAARLGEAAAKAADNIPDS